jgi:(p)ppGpp synthase/HD superfamily hydrolase
MLRARSILFVLLHASCPCAMTSGYSDRINHALAFAAKHHDRQVRKGTSLPYLTQPANVAIILARYDQDTETIVAGILHDVVEDCVREGYSRHMLDTRLGDKFGSDVLDTLLAITLRKIDDEGVELSADDRRTDLLRRLERTSEQARWVYAADALHNVGSLLADLRRTLDPETVWSRFSIGKAGTIMWYRQVVERLHAAGFASPIMSELDALVGELEDWRNR